MGVVFSAGWVWIIAGLALTGLEILVPGAFLLWVGLGALAVGVLLTLLPDLTLGWQLVIFAACMLGSLAVGVVLQGRSRRTHNSAFLNRELQAMVGRSYVAIDAFEAGRGRIRAGDTSYSVISEDIIAAGDTVQVIGIDDGRLKVARQPSEKSTHPTGKAQ